MMKNDEMIKLDDVMKYCIYYGNVHVDIYMYMCVGMVYSAMCHGYVMILQTRDKCIAYNLSWNGAECG